MPIIRLSRPLYGTVLSNSCDLFMLKPYLVYHIRYMDSHGATAAAVCHRLNLFIYLLFILLFYGDVIEQLCKCRTCDGNGMYLC